MKYTRLPNTELDVSVIAMGCWALSGDATWGVQDENDAIDAIRASLDLGINFFVFLGCFLVGSSRVDLQACKLEYYGSRPVSTARSPR